MFAGDFVCIRQDMVEQAEVGDGGVVIGNVAGFSAAFDGLSDDRGETVGDSNGVRFETADNQESHYN